MPAQIHRIYSSLPISCCIAISFLQTNRNQPMSFVPSWVPYAEQPAYTLQIVGTRSEQSARILSLCGNACTVNFMDLLPLLTGTCTRCSEPCGNYSALLSFHGGFLFSSSGKAALACAFLGISWHLHTLRSTMFFLSAVLLGPTLL